MPECDLLEKCGFFKKYGSTLDVASKGFILLYCKGSKMNDCARKKYREQHGRPPADEMLPSGQTMPKGWVRK